MKMMLPFLCLFFLFPPPSLIAEKTSPSPFIHNSGLLINPKDPSVLYASFWIYGVYKSTDYGKTWRPVNRGFKNTSAYTLRMDPHDSHILFAGTYAGGIYTSTDGGETWAEVNTGLTSSTIWDLAVNPSRPEGLSALTSLGLFTTDDGGQHWTLLPGGLPGQSPPDQQMTLFMLPPGPSTPPTLLLQNGGLLFRWTGVAWSPPLLREVTKIRATPLAVEPRSGTLYAGTEKGLVMSRDGGITWRLISSHIKKATWIVIHPTRPDTLYIGTDGTGIVKSPDGGRTFQPVNNGLTGPTSLRIFGLAIDPKDPRRLYAASHSIGLFRTEDGGEHWVRPDTFPIPSISELAAQTRAVVHASSARASSLPPPPPEFLVHCNKCHGWADPLLDAGRDVVWRAAPTPRDWTATVNRMGNLAGLNDAQTTPITTYLNTYFGP